jgi:hypothetical protein
MQHEFKKDRKAHMAGSFRIAAGILAFVSGIASAAPQLLIPTARSQDGPGAMVLPKAGSATAVRFNAEEIFNLPPGAEVELTLPDGSRHTYLSESTVPHGGGMTTWIARSPLTGDSERAIITYSDAGAWGWMQTRHGMYRLSSSGGKQEWLAASPNRNLAPKDGGSDAVPARNDAPGREALKGVPTFVDPVTLSQALPAPRATPAPAVRIDVMFLYTRDLANRLGGSLTPMMNNIIVSLNIAYADSEVAITARLVKTTMIDVDNAKGSRAIVTAMDGGGDASLAAFFQPITWGVGSLRDTYGADYVAVLRDGPDDTGGVGNLTKNPTPGVLLSTKGYSVSNYCAEGCERIVAHEIGHNMGNHHDRATLAKDDTTPPAGEVPDIALFPDSYGFYSCSAGLTCNPFASEGALTCTSGYARCAAPYDANDFGDIMSYFNPAVTKFSNPNVMCVPPGGDPAFPRPCGDAETDIARGMNLIRTNLSAYRNETIANLPGSLQFTATGYANPEAGGPLVFSVSRAGGSSGAVSVNYAVTGATATGGTDFVVASGTLSWADGDSATKLINVTLTPDALTEGPESLLATLSAPTGPLGVHLGHPAVAIGFITEPWPPFDVAPAGFTNPPSPASSVTWAVVPDGPGDPTPDGGGSSYKSGALDFAVKNCISSDPGYGNVPCPSATRYTGDFADGVIAFAYRVSGYPGYGFLELLIDGTVVFAATTAMPSVDSGWQYAQVNVTWGVHTVEWRYRTVLYFACAASFAGCEDRAWIDQVSMPPAVNNVGFIADVARTVAEGAGSVPLAVHRSGPLTTTASVNWATTSGTATAGADFPAASGTLTWAVGDGAPKIINVAISQDAVLESLETFAVNLSSPVNTTIKPSGATATISITDDEVGVFPAGCAIPAGYVQSAGSNAGWNAATDAAFEGTCSLKSGAIADSQTAAIEHTATFPAGTLSFRYKVSSELAWDCFRFSIDGAFQALPASGPCDNLSPIGTTAAGEVPWTLFSKAIPAGAHTLKWLYVKDTIQVAGGDAAWIDDVKFVALPTPTTTLASSTNPSAFGQSVTFTATVSGASGTPTGTVNFRDGGVTIPGCGTVALSGGGTAGCTTAALAVGTRTITAVYSGSGTYATSTSANLGQVVSKVVTATVIGASAAQSSSGTPVTFTATVSGGAPTGTVAFRDGGTPLAACSAVAVAAGSAQCTTSALPTGARSMSAAYSGDGAHAASTSATITHTVAVPAVAMLASSTPAVAFGGQSMSTTAPAQAVTLSNTGAAALTITSITAPAPFAVTHNCASLVAGATCVANVTFTPTAEGAAAGNLTIVASVSPPAVSLSGTGEKSLVTHYYRSILRRAPDAGGKTYWEGEAARVSALGANVNETWYALAMQFFVSSEYVAFNRDNTGFVTDLYNTFFNRTPDAAGLAYWNSQMAGGMPREVVLVGFMFSPEFAAFTQAIFGNTAARAEVDTVVDFYRGLLSRLPDSAGFNYWVGQFRTAQCSGPAAVYAQVEAISSAYANSPEYGARARTNAQFVGDVYNSFLRRGGDLAGVNYWISQLATGARTRENVRQAFISTPEFGARVQAIINQGCL